MWSVGIVGTKLDLALLEHVPMSQLLYGILESWFLPTRFLIKTVTAVSIH